MRFDLPRVAFWLVPDAEARKWLSGIIGHLARRFATPVFLPHVTLYCCERTTRQSELTVLAGLARQANPIRLSITGVASGLRPTKTLYYSIEPVGILYQFVQVLRAGAPNVSSYQFNPHLSLLYQEKGGKAHALHDELRPAQNTLCFDELRAVAIPGQLNVLADFNGWQTLLAARLTQSD